MVHVSRILEAGTGDDPVSQMPRAVVVIPAYQARLSIGELVRAVANQNLPVLVVDDASTDGTTEEAKKSGATVLRLPVNQGKGAALREGFSKALAGPYDWILTLDADGQHLPDEIPKFFEAAHDKGADMVLGNRMENPEGMPLVRRLTNGLMSRLLSRMTHQSFPDSQCGFRLIHRRVLEGLSLSTHRFEIESELLVKAARAGFKIVSIPVRSFYSTHVSFIRPFKDTVRFFRFLSNLNKEPTPKRS